LKPPGASRSGRHVLLPPPQARRRSAPRCGAFGADRGEGSTCAGRTEGGREAGTAGGARRAGAGAAATTAQDAMTAR